MVSGMMLRSREMNTLEHSSTASAARPIPTAPSTVPVVARVGQVPRMSTRTGFSFRMPFISTCILLSFLITWHLLPEFPLP